VYVSQGCFTAMKNMWYTSNEPSLKIAQIFFKIQSIPVANF